MTLFAVIGWCVSIVLGFAIFIMWITARDLNKENDKLRETIASNDDEYSDLDQDYHTVLALAHDYLDKIETMHGGKRYARKERGKLIDLDADEYTGHEDDQQELGV